MNRRNIHLNSENTQDTRKEQQWAENVFPKRCSCGAVYRQEDWMQFPSLGVLPGTNKISGRRISGDIELRVCICGSSVSVKLKEL